jgi:hypothetical protein
MFGSPHYEPAMRKEPRIMKPLDDSERQLAEAAARVIAKAEEIGLPDAPEKLVTPHAIRFLARGYIELRDALREFHDRIDQISRVAINGALNEVARQQGGIAGTIIDEAKSEGMLAVKPFVAQLPRRPRDWSTTEPRLVRSPAEIAALTVDQLVEIYCHTMRDVAAVFIKYETYIVRHWDGMDGCWTDVTGDVGREEALRAWADRTDGGAHHVAYAEIDYYRIFPGGTRMDWDGSEGREMHR